MDQEALRQIEQITGHQFSNLQLLQKAFTHSSVVDNRFLSNERLEFLGDSVLAVVICKILFERFPAYLEGDLTKVKSMLVSRRTCARVAQQLGLQKFLKVGKGMTRSQSLSGSLAAGALEAVIGAIYIDGGLDAVSSFIQKAFGSLMERADAGQTHGNFKSLLQQYAQQQLNTTPSYNLLDEKGPDHDKCFEVEVVIDKQHFPSAWGTNKKEAEQKAASNALVVLGVLHDSSGERRPD
jgi:ribonuclease-3